MSNPRVSVLMAVRNGQDFLAKSIDSILIQTLADLELIVVDDGSSDGTWQIISEYAVNDGRIVPLRNEKTQGTSRALNRALAMARGDYITRQDGDDQALPVRLEQQVESLENNPSVGAVGTAITLIDNKDYPSGTRHFPLENAEIQQMLLDHMCFCGPTVLVRRSSFCAAGFYFNEEMSYSEDYDLCLRLAEVAELANLFTPLYFYRLHAGSVSQTHRYQQIFRKATALENAINRRYGVATPPQMRAYIAKDYVRAAVIAFSSNQFEDAHRCLQRSLMFTPVGFEYLALVEEVIWRYASHHSSEQRLTFVASIFANLFPQTYEFVRLKSRLLAKLHMSEVFSGLHQDQMERVNSHLWLGLLLDRAWLFNRGVWAIAMKTITWRILRSKKILWRRFS